jgi:hypothetical protein
MKARPMRVFAPSCALLAASVLFACGGGTPPPKDSDEAVASSAPKAPAQTPPADSAASTPATAAAGDPLAPSPSPSATPSADSASPAGDDPWLASHQMPPKDVLRATRPAQGKAQACFRAGVKRDPSTSGEVKIRFVTTNDGTVRVWRDEGSSMSDADVTQCVGELLKTLKFPKQKSPGDAYGVYTVNFSN